MSVVWSGSEFRDLAKFFARLEAVTARIQETRRASRAVGGLVRFRDNRTAIAGGVAECASICTPATVQFAM